MNTMAVLPLRENTGKPNNASTAYTQATRRALQRTVQALFRESLLPAQNLQAEGSTAWLTLTDQIQCGFQHIKFGPSGSCVIQGAVLWQVQGQPCEAIESPMLLLQRLATYLKTQIDPHSLARLCEEIDNHINNDALCIAYRRGWGDDLAKQVSHEGYEFFITWLREAAHIDNKTLLLEQWGTIGHPWHPNYKTKLGLQAHEVMEMSPEFRASIAVGIAALRADTAVVSGVNDVAAYQAWFAKHYPQAWMSWQSAILAAGETLAQWVPLPLHPFQQMHTVPEQYADEIRLGILRLLPDVSIQASPTMSFRSVVPQASTTMPHMKLPVALRLTSVQRTVSPKSAVMGTRFTDLFQSIADQGDFDAHLLFVGEQVGLYYQDAAKDDDRGRHLAVLYRQNPLQCVANELMVVPVGSLFAESPLTGQPLMTELVALYSKQHRYACLADAAIGFFRSYATVVVSAALHAYLTLGIAFEAHQQNSFIILDEKFLPVQVLIRDFGDVRIFEPQLKAAGYALQAYREGHSLFNEIETVRDKFLHATMLCHVGELAVALARCYHIEEAMLWRALREIVQDTFSRCEDQLPADHWQQEYDAILNQPWPAKALFTMRISDLADDIVNQMSNPLQA